LAAALFTFVHSHDSSARPSPLQVQTFSGEAVGDGSRTSEAPGLGARLWGSAAGSSSRPEAAGLQQLQRQGIRWCYPQEREVALLVIEASKWCLHVNLSCKVLHREAFIVCVP
jgi:N-dimethylarginine dimethylaminohydrolase